MPKSLYNYHEFIHLSHDGRIPFEKIEVPKNAILLNNSADLDNYVYLIIDGYVALFLNDGKEQSKIYSIQGEGAFLNYFTLLDHSINRFRYKTLSK